MQIAAPLSRPVRRFIPSGNLRPRPILLAILVLGVLIGIGVVAYQRLFATAAPAPIGQVVPAQRGNIASTVSATGSVVATKQAKLVFTNSGKLKDVLVNVGDQVSSGQVLAHLVSDSALVKLDTARSQLVTAQLKLQQLTEAATAEDVAAAQAAYDAAAAKLADVTAGPLAADMAAAQSAVIQAQSNLDEASGKLATLESGATRTDRASAQAGLFSAQNTLAAAQAKLDQLTAGPLDADVAAAQAAVVDAQANLRTAEAKYGVQAGATQAQLAADQAGYDKAVGTLATARAQLELAKANAAVPQEVSHAQATLADAEKQLHDAHQALDQQTADFLQASATVAAQDAAFAAAQKSADQTCNKLGDSSAECAAAKSKLIEQQPQILQAEQQLRLVDGSGSWQQLSARKAVLAAQASYNAAADSLKQAEAAHSVGVDLITAQRGYDSAISDLTSAKARLDQSKASAATVDVITAQAAVDQARAALASAQAKLDLTLQGAQQADTVAAETAALTAQANVDAAQVKLDQLGVPTPQDLQSARSAKTSALAALQSAQVKLDQLNQGPTQTDLEAARSALVSAQATLATRSGSARPSDIALQQEAVRQAELALQQAQLDYDANTLVAPFDGVVAAVNGNPGETAPAGGSSSSSSATSSTGGFITLVDPREVRVDVTVDETDVARLAVGKSASVTFDAIPGRGFRGKVIAMSPTGTLSQGVVTYPVSISLDSRGQVIPAGLTASATIVIDQKDDVLVVPLRAVRRQGRDQVLDILGEDGKPLTRVVRTGVQNDQSVEITDGLDEGESVVLQGTTTRAPTTFGGPGAPPGAGRVVIGR